ncbi:prolyl-tRNA synthetase associated domain-containing protein [Candidatus Dependentiae bacterium]|jgi:Ala-tRNA(Pro) deacylase|nr:prolyl-tRNA synthetase associated domain-containing protein [Candidatus Dependentiae bacterium]
MNDIYAFLKDNNIAYERFDHPAVFTCEEAKELCPPMPGCSIKNLFLYDSRSGQHFLVVISEDKRIDLKKLKDLLNVSKLSFGSEERLKEYLGVEPGSVTILGLMNDTGHAVRVIFDQQIWGQPLQSHPLINTATLVIQPQDVEAFLKATGHSYEVIDIQSRE